MIRVYDSGYRGDCRSERCEQIDAISWLSVNYPDRFPLIFHCPGETKASPQHMQMRSKEGVKPGIPDIIDMNRFVGLFEMKRADRTKSKLRKDQKAVLEEADWQGHFSAVCYGFEQFKGAYLEYIQWCEKRRLT